jgi:putative membrane protein
MNTKTTLTFTAAVLSMALLTACNQGGDTGAGAAAGDTTAATDASATGASADAMNPGGTQPADAGAMTEADALGLVMLVDEHEIASAEQARDKKTSAPVREYADMLHTEHTANLERARALESSTGVTAGSGAMVTEMRAKMEADRTRMAGLEGEEFERAYVTAKAQGHQEVLTMLEQQLIPAAQNDAVRQHLQVMRDAVAKHLEHARELQGQVAGGATTNDAAAASGEGAQTPSQ